MEFRKTVKMELDDHIAFSWFVTKKPLVFMLILIFVLIPVFTWLNNGVKTTFDDLLITYCICIVSLGLSIPLFKVLFRRSLKKQLDSNRITQAPNEILIDDEGVRTSSEFGNSNLPWQNIFKAAEGKKAYYVYIAKGQAFFIPKRLMSADEEETLQALLKRHLPPDKVRFSKRG